MSKEFQELTDELKEQLQEGLSQYEQSPSPRGDAEDTYCNTWRKQKKVRSNVHESILPGLWMRIMYYMEHFASTN